MRRLKCPRCSNVVEVPPGSRPVCSACGFGAQPAAKPPAPAPAPAAAPAPAPAAAAQWAPLSPVAAKAPFPAGGPGPRGKVREPWAVLGLTLVTLGIYSYVYWWKVSAEVDAYTRRNHVHPPVRRGILLSLSTIALLVLMLALLAGSIASLGSGSGGALLAFGALTFLVYLAILAVAITAVVYLLIGLWRLWSTLRERELEAGATNPLSPGVQLAFFLIPYVNIVTLWIALYRTQAHLNAMWQDRVLP